MSGKYKTSQTWNNNVYDSNTKIYKDPISNKEYDLSHMHNVKGVELKFETKVDGEKIKGVVLVDVFFNHHCYTSERKSSDTSVTFVTDIFSDGSTVERVFDEERYSYTHQLCHLVANLDHKLCKGSRTNKKDNKVIRLEDKKKQNPSDAIYVLMKMKRSVRSGNPFNLYIETSHRRRNEPAGLDLAKSERKHMLILGDWLKGAHADFLDDFKAKTH